MCGATQALALLVAQVPQTDGDSGGGWWISVEIHNLRLARQHPPFIQLVVTQRSNLGLVSACTASKNTRYNLGAEPYEPRAFAMLTSNRWSASGTLKILHVSSTNEVAVSQKQDTAGWHVQAQCLEPTIRTLDSVASCIVTQDSRTERDAAECQERVCAPSGRCVSTVTSDANAGLWHGFSRLNP